MFWAGKQAPRGQCWALPVPSTLSWRAGAGVFGVSNKKQQSCLTQLRPQHGHPLLSESAALPGKKSLPWRVLTWANARKCPAWVL